jgi:hypothetical protein
LAADDAWAELRDEQSKEQTCVWWVLILLWPPRNACLHASHVPSHQIIYPNHYRTDMDVNADGFEVLHPDIAVPMWIPRRTDQGTPELMQTASDGLLAGPSHILLTKFLQTC